MWRDRLLRLYEFVITGLTWLVVVTFLLSSLTRETYTPPDMPAKVRPYTGGIDFNFVDWTLDAVGRKVEQASLNEQAYLTEAARTVLVLKYFDWQAKLDGIENSIAQQYADPAVKDPAAATEGLRTMEAAARAHMDELRPAAEAILQEQLSVILNEQGLTTGGQPFPSVAFHFTPLPLALVISPRDHIEQVVNTDVKGTLTLDEQVALEERVATGLDVSALLVPLGGIGTYPTMVAQSSDLNWIASVTAHEWAHNYLTLRPLGLNYETSPDLRTMNETTAEMFGDEVGALVMARYYPDRQPPPAPFSNILPRILPPEQQTPPGFDFRAEMHTTRVRADELLAAGQIKEAEMYMEQRRQFFWANGYRIRKLNQAYFAFYGAYAAGGGGAAGVDPVGPAVRLLRRRSLSIAAFMNTMAGFTRFEQLEIYLGLK
jgi:hypothetical protein